MLLYNITGYFNCFESIIYRLFEFLFLFGFFKMAVYLIKLSYEKGINMSEEFEKEKLDSPLIVHKKTDASYTETANSVDADSTHAADNNASNLVRHRFKRVKRRRKAPYIILAIVIIAAILCGLYYGGVIGNRKENKENTTSSRGYIEVTENRFEGVITVKSTYIFFEGEEVDGIEGLERKIRYLDEKTKFVVQDEEADPVFLNEEILPLLTENGIEYEGPNFIISSGLKSKYETEIQAQTEASTNEVVSAAE